MANNQKIPKKCKSNTASIAPKERSMGRLIVWNIAKAIEKNPQLNLKDALRETSFKLENKLPNVNLGCLHENPEERYLACAMLAWQQLGHAGADSLCNFVMSKSTPRSASDEFMSRLSKPKCDKKKVMETPYNFDRSMLCGSDCCTANVDVGMASSAGKIAKCVHITNFPESLPPAAITEVSSNCTGCVLNSYNMGPVVRLPTNATCMRVEHTPSQSYSKKQERDSIQEQLPSTLPPSEIDMSCCTQPTCMERLKELDTMTQELRMRSANLAKREAERVELLERAESSWRNVEQGYQRRLKLAEDGEFELLKQVKYSIDERNGYKEQSAQLAITLRENAEQVENMREALKEQDKLLFDRATKRSKVNAELSRVETHLTDAHSKAWQLDRELQFKEEQARRKLATMESEMNSARALTIETERALRSQLGTLRNQINNISKQLLEEDERNKVMAAAVEELSKEKAALIETLETCKEKCECSIKEVEEAFKQKREEYEDLSIKVANCLCHNPVEISTEAKRTPSLAAMCACDPDEIPPECGCTSMPNNLLSTMLSGLFAGLRDELTTIGINMPCPLLKCLDDCHSWETASPVKAAVKNFFTNLLVGELEIAISSCIERHHAKWVGATCVDEKEESSNVRQQQELAIEKRAQKLATKLAEELFNQKADKLTDKAKEILKSAPPPCDCDPRDRPEKHDPAIYSCFVRSNAKLNETPREYKEPVKPKPTNPSKLWRQTQQDVTQLRAQIENLRKATLNKGNFRNLEEKITRAVKNVTGSSKINHSMPLKDSARATNTEHKKVFYGEKLKAKKHVEYTGSSKKQYQSTPRKPTQSYAVNLCFYEPDQDPKKIVCGKSRCIENSQKLSNLKSNSSQRKGKPLDPSTPDSVVEADEEKLYCENKSCNCFNRKPSNTSINNLLNTLAKWKGDLINDQASVNTEPDFGFFPGALAPTVNRNETNTRTAYKINQNVGIVVDTPQIKDKCCLKTFDNPVLEEHNAINATESEYIGTINLEKSNEINPHSKNAIQDTKEEFSPTIYKYNPVITTGTQSSASKHQKGLDESIQYSNSIIKDRNNSSETLKNELSSCYCDYDIKLLGVTLTECDSKKTRAKKKIRSSYCRQSNYIVNVVNEESKDNNTIPKVLDALTTPDRTPKEPECACCRPSVDSSQTFKDDLEINTFSLLEEFLKKRLQKHKNESCESKCYTKEEENQMIAGMIRNIKKTISNSTKCKCASENENDNFKRGYCLLQEYLKLKLKRVQCAYPDEKSKNNQITDIYEKICLQIENDFQRLKDVCKCKKANINFEQPEKDTNTQKMESLKQEVYETASKSINCASKEFEKTVRKRSEVVQAPSVSTPQENSINSNACFCDGTQGSPKTYNSSCNCKEKNAIENIDSEITDNSSKILDNTVDKESKDKKDFKESSSLQNSPETKKKAASIPKKMLGASSAGSETSNAIESPSLQSSHIENTISETNQSCSEPESALPESKSEKISDSTKSRNNNSNGQEQVVCITEVISGQTMDNASSKRIEICTNSLPDNEVQKIESRSSKNPMPSSEHSATISNNDSSKNHARYVPVCTCAKQCHCTNNEYKENTNRDSIGSRNIVENIENKEVNSNISQQNHNNTAPNLSYTLSCSCNSPCYCSNSIPKERNNTVNGISSSRVSNQQPQLTETQVSNDNDVLKDQNNVLKEAHHRNRRSYTGYTMDCSRDVYDGSCSCYQGPSNKLNDIIQNMWANSINKESPLSKFSYIMEKVKKDTTADFNAYTDTVFQPPKIEKDSIESEGVKFNEAEMNTQYDNDIVLLAEKSRRPMDCAQQINKRLWNSDDVASENWYECCSAKNQTTSVPHKDFVNEEVCDDLGQYKSSKAIGVKPEACDCGMVPVCHVKMLMQNIEDKLDKSKCTCDALKSSVCPIHATKK